MALKQPRHVLVFLLALTTAFGVIAASPLAEQILDKTAKAMTSAKSVTVKFGYTAGGNHSNGSMTMSGKKFTFNLGNIAVWYNGTLQWALNRSDNEVTLTKPTAAEVVESNPFAILTSYKQRYTPSLTKKAKSEYIVTLRPKKRGGQITTATIRINAANYYPAALTLRLSDESSVSVSVTSVSSGAALPATYFQYDTRSNPKVELIDLR